MAAECLEGRAFFSFIDMLFKQQERWLAASDVPAALFEVRCYAEAAPAV